MKKTFFVLLTTMISFSAFAQSQISVTIDGQSYVCSGNGSGAAAPTVSSTFCRCTPSPWFNFERVAVMSDGTSKLIESQDFKPGNGSYNPEEVSKKCEARVRSCGGR